MASGKQLFFITILLLPTFCFAEGQTGLDYFVWTIDFIKVFALWSIVAFLILAIIKNVRGRAISKKQKIIFWSLILLAAFFNWSMTTYDPYPTDGSIDHFIWKDKLKLKAIEDSLIAVKYLEELHKQNISVSIKGKWYLNKWTMYHTLIFNDTTVYVDNNIDSVFTSNYTLTNDSLIVWLNNSSKKYRNKIISLTKDNLILKGFSDNPETLNYSRTKLDWKN